MTTCTSAINAVDAANAAYAKFNTAVEAFDASADVLDAAEASLDASADVLDAAEASLDAAALALDAAEASLDAANAAYDKEQPNSYELAQIGNAAWTLTELSPQGDVVRQIHAERYIWLPGRTEPSPLFDTELRILRYLRAYPETWEGDPMADLADVPLCRGTGGRTMAYPE